MRRRGSGAAPRDPAALFGGARDLIDLWAERRGRRLRDPQSAAVQALALSAAMELFEECEPTREALSASALFLRHEARGLRLFDERPEHMARIIDIFGDDGTHHYAIPLGGPKLEPCKPAEREQALSHLKRWNEIATGEGTWREIRERFHAALSGEKEVRDPARRFALRALTQVMLCLIRSEDARAQIQAAQTLLRQF
ncbi:MAG: hypothetical protein KDH09_17850, partial [Chrysiogenetes bacterium]|nr:hypothetical protein [Chrysiogenetes bacterium]